jgi:hypothetical protein
MRVATQLFLSKADHMQYLNDSVPGLQTPHQIVYEQGFSHDVLYLHSRIERCEGILVDELHVPSDRLEPFT